MNRFYSGRPVVASLAIVLPMVFSSGPAAGGDEPSVQTARFRILGLFQRDRVDDLRRTVETLGPIRLVRVDFDDAEAILEYDPAMAFPGAKPEQIVERLDSLLRQASNHTFGARPLGTVPKEKLRLVEIRVAGLDCKACSFAAYDSVARLPGVEQATASFKEGLVTARIDPEKIDRTELETALKQRGVELKSP